MEETKTNIKKERVGNEDGEWFSFPAGFVGPLVVLVVVVGGGAVG